jgi:hypothetical protein
MKRYTVSMARERFADVLDEADRSGAVVIERRDVKYVIRAVRKSKARRPGRSIIETVDKDVASGQWRWDWNAEGIRFAGRRRS